MAAADELPAALPPAFLAFLQRNGLDASIYAAAATLPRYIRCTLYFALLFRCRSCCASSEFHEVAITNVYIVMDSMPVRGKNMVIPSK